MKFMMPKARTRPFLPLFATLACAACVGAPPIVTAKSACSSLLPSDWEKGVEGAPIPDGETVADWVAFGDAQTGQLDKANDRYRAATGIVRRCENRDREAIAQSRPRFLGIF